MTKDRDGDEGSSREGDRYEVSVVGDVSGQFAVGRDIRQERTEVVLPPELLDEVRAAIGGLKARVTAEAPAELASEALEQLEEVEQAIAESPEPAKLTTRLGRAREWFLRRLPSMVGALSSLVIHPLAGRMVEHLSEPAAEAIARRLGLPAHDE